VTSRGERASRGAAIAVFATFVASLAHTVGGGAVPGPVAVLVALAFSAPLAMLLAGARARLLRTSISALIAQAALHLCYALGGASTIGGPAADAGAHSGHGAPVNLDAVLTTTTVDHGHALMPIAHVLAAAITVTALALGDDVFDAIHRSVLLFVRRLTTTPALGVVTPFRIEAGVGRQRLIGTQLRAALGSRGPPSAVVAS
jgi:hypothetical protein